jgi:CRP-like cAMP-binding protein
VAFGLIAGITMQTKSTEVFFQKMHSIKELIEQNGGDVTQKSKVEQFFAYSWHLQRSTNMVSIKSLSTQLPYRLSKEVVYYSTKHLLEPMFKSFGSENLIKDVSTALEQTIYLPGDFIILKDDIGEEMFFIAEGSVYILAADKRTVLNTLTQGCFFGEMAIFLESNKRTAYVQAETFCSILILKKADLDNIKINYPAVAKDIRKEAQKRQAETKEIEEAQKEEMWKDIDDPEEQKKDLERIYATPPGFRIKAFSPKQFETTSRRSSFDAPKDGFTDTLEASLPKPERKRSQFIQKAELDEEQDEEDKHSLEGVKLSKTKKFKSTEDPGRVRVSRVIEEDDEESKSYEQSDSSFDDYNLIPVSKKTVNNFLSSAGVSDPGNRTDPQDSSKNLPMAKREQSLNQNLLLKPGLTVDKNVLKRSTTANIDNKMENEEEKGPESPRLHKGKLAKMLRDIECERKLHNKTVGEYQKTEEAPPEKMDITDYRRKGVLKQRRLSRINLGKQLALSETSGLRLQWIVE